jgi:DNA-binding NarL/FixJ family response regulator
MYLPPKILIFESRMIIAADVSLQLSKLGYEVIGIHSKAEGALKTIQLNRPDIIVMNIDTKSSTGGLNTARGIAEILSIPMVFLSAHTDRVLLQQLIHLNPYALITKPFEVKDLQRGLETTLGRMVAEGLWPILHQRQ